MSHLHVPDGVLPWTLWVPAWAIALSGLLVASIASRRDTPRQIAFRGALGALLLAAMTLAVPLGPIEYHLSLLGPLGVLLGPAASLEVLFVIASILAFVGHGGLTVVGLNVLVLGAGAAVARPVYSALAPRVQPPAAMAAAAAASQGVSGAAWAAVMVWTLGSRPGAWLSGKTLPWVAGAVLAVWLGGVIVETLVAFGLARFLTRVKPELLPLRAQVSPTAAAARG